MIVYALLRAFYVSYCATIFAQPVRVDHPLRAANVAPARTNGFAVDIRDREAVRNFFNAVFYAGSGVRSGWAGNVTNCDAGSTSAEYQAAVLTRINFYRAMAGVPADVDFDPVLSEKSRPAALVVSANEMVTHAPPATFSCYTPEAREAAEISNLALGTSGIDSIEAYMLDAGGNYRVGHRRWLLYPQTQQMGNADIDPPDGSNTRRANANWSYDSNFGGPRPATRDGFAAWPPPGFVPHKVVYPRWSFSMPRADFTNALVTVSSNGVALPVQIEKVELGYGEETIVFVPGQIDPWVRAVAARPGNDVQYTVGISNVVIGGVTTNFDYSVTVFDPDVSSGNTVALTGSTQPEMGRTNRYRIASAVNASAYDFRVGTLAPFREVATADNESVDVQATISTLYPLVQTNIFASGKAAFHLAHTTPPRPQWFILKKVIVPSMRSELRFQSRLGAASTGQVARAQVSLDEGQSWREIFSQFGDGQSGELGFTARSVSLAAFAGRAVLVRFEYGFPFGAITYAPGAFEQVGWYLDDIHVTFAQELEVEQMTTLSKPEFQFTPVEARNYFLDARPRFFGEFGGEWAGGILVSAVPPSTTVGSVNIVGIRMASGSIELEFEAPEGTAIFQLEEARELNGGWEIRADASLEASAGESGRYVYRLAGSVEGVRFFRVTID